MFKSLANLLATLTVAGLSLPVHAAELPTRAEDVRPLLLGSASPTADLQTLDGSQLSLTQALAGRPTVLVFYRGGWCPFCNLQLSELRHLDGDLQAHGFQLIALSPDRPELLAEAQEDAENMAGYRLLSDASGAAMRAFGIAFEVDEATRKRYTEYGIDLAAASGHQHYALPVPAVFVIDAAGVLQFSYVNPDYRTRVPLRLVRAAIEAVAAGETGKPMR